MDHTDALRAVAIFSALDDDVISNLAGEIVTVTFAPGTRFITEGQADEDAYLITDGEAEVSVRGRRVAKLSSGQMIGEVAAAMRRPRTASATAVTTVQALVITGEMLRDLMKAHPRFASTLARMMSLHES